MKRSRDEWCLCRGPDDGRRMIECSKCMDWFHYNCVGLLEKVTKEMEKVTWYCPKCAQNVIKALRKHIVVQDKHLAWKEACCQELREEIQVLKAQRPQPNNMVENVLQGVVGLSSTLDKKDLNIVTEAEIPKNDGIVEGSHIVNNEETLLTPENMVAEEETPNHTEEVVIRSGQEETPKCSELINEERPLLPDQTLIQENIVEDTIISLKERVLPFKVLLSPPAIKEGQKATLKNFRTGRLSLKNNNKKKVK
ncbi:Transcription initiation factor TFIID subunit 3 [Frankliniella fusca]|uniref:Transcription initiation factor TFIID subunit 3 n=1 Tax=Frankliniella fusca TaxID=407009 RepID=A0AAE1LE16_9NEOP|nr:Transcription initiation factor TFIID subunit 3 [Frankliniella fusca]